MIEDLITLDGIDGSCRYPMVDVLHDCPSYTTIVTINGLTAGDRVVVHRVGKAPVEVEVDEQLTGGVYSNEPMPHNFWFIRYNGTRNPVQSAEYWKLQERLKEQHGY